MSRLPATRCGGYNRDMTGAAKILLIVAWTATCAHAATPASTRAADPIATILKTRDFRHPALDALDPAEAVTRLLDALLPDTALGAPPAPRSRDIAALIEQLGSPEGDVRQKATRRLIRMGPDFGGAVERAAGEKTGGVQIVSAGTDVPPEVRLRAREVVRAWRRVENERGRREFDIRTYIARLKDRRALEVVRERARRALDAASPGEERRQLLGACVGGLMGATGRDERYAETFRPLLAHPEEDVALLVVNAIGSWRDSNYFPLLLLDALKDPRPNVVDEALNGTTRCLDERRDAAVRETVHAIFGGPDGKLKFHAAGVLVHDWDDADATRYMIMEVKSRDRDRQLSALAWLQEIPVHRPPPPGLLEAAGPLLRSNEAELRQAAVETIGTYTGDQVLQLLIPVLSDPAPEVRYFVFDRLRFLDRAAVGRALNDAARGDADRDVRARAMLFLQHPELAPEPATTKSVTTTPAPLPQD